MKKILVPALVALLLAALTAGASAEVRSSGPGPLSAPVTVQGPHDIWPPIGAK